MYAEVPFSDSSWNGSKSGKTEFGQFGAQIPACRPLARPIIYQPGILQSPESPKSLHKLVLPENVPRSGFYTIIVGEMGPKASN